MSTTTEQPKTKVVTCMARFSYAHIWEPKAVEDGGTKKYSLTLIIPKNEKKCIAEIKAAIEAAKLVGKNSKVFGGKIPANCKTTFYDGDVEYPDDEAYVNSMFLRCASTTKPQVVDAKKNVIEDPTLVYSGCYGRASVNFYPFDKNSKGIACGLGNIQKIKDGEPLSGRSSADEDFDEIEVSDDADDLI